MEKIYRVSVVGMEGCFLLVSELYKIKYHHNQHKDEKELEMLVYQAGFIHVVCYIRNGWLCMVIKK